MSTTEPRTTLATVAASAGVSVATVSKVLNGRRDVAPATRARVQEMLRTHDYGGRLKMIERHPTIELTFRGTIGCYSSEIVQGVAAAAAELGVAVTIGVKSVDQRPSASIEAATWARNLAVNGRRAVIAVTDELGHDEIAALARDATAARRDRPDERPLARHHQRGVDQLPRRSGRRPAPRRARTPTHRLPGWPRVSGVQPGAPGGLSLRARGGRRSACPRSTCTAPRTSTTRTGSRGLPGSCRSLQRPTAIFAASDELARGVIEAARAVGLSVPDDLSIVGFDDTEIARIASPPLTTVRQPLQEMGAVALRTVLRLVAGEKIESNHVELATDARRSRLDRGRAVNDRRARCPRDTSATVNHNGSSGTYPPVRR